MKKDINTPQYIQFSKKVTQWGILSISIGLILCLLLVSFLNLPTENISTILHLYTAYATTLGIIVGAYQGNSTLEKWSKARYNTEETENLDLNLEDEREDEL